MSDLKNVIGNIEKRFGKEAISSNDIEIDFYSTGILSLDLALGGGIAKGRIIELFGWESTGKSTLALMLAAQVQESGKAVGYIDMEHAVDLAYANNLGVDVDYDSEKWVMSQPDNGEQALEITRELIKSEDVGLVVIDSVTALIPKAVLQGEAGDSKMGLQARLMSSMLPAINSALKKTGCTVLFINQLREKIGVMFGNPVTTTGGNALKFYASQRMEIARIGQEKDGDEVLSNRTRVKVVKNKVAPPHQKTEFLIEFGTGVDIFRDFIEVAVGFDIIKKSGSWYSYGEVRLGQGLDNSKEYLIENPEITEEIKLKLNDFIK